MLVIGHRGARGLAPENTLESMERSIEAGALIVEFDIQLTKDKIPVVVHDRNLLRTHEQRRKISTLTAHELTLLTVDHRPVPTLKQVLDTYWGRVYLNIEIKGRDTGVAVIAELENRCQKTDDWDNCFISSFSPRELQKIRTLTPHANLGLLHNANPFIFLAYYRKLRLAAVGWHRLHTNLLATEIAKKLGIFSYAYTVNRPHAAKLLAQQGIDAVVTDYPNRILSEFDS